MDNKYNKTVPSKKARAIPAPVWSAFRESNPKPPSRRDQIRANMRSRKFTKFNFANPFTKFNFANPLAA